MRKNGTPLHVELTVSPIRDTEGRLTGAATICRDITERKAAEEQFHLAIEAAPNGMLLVDSEGRIVLVNRQAEKMFGYRRDELIGHKVEMLLPDRFRPAHTILRGKYIAQPTARPMGVGRDLYALRKDGIEVPVEIGLSPIVTEQGTMVLTAAVDITERKRAEVIEDTLVREIQHRSNNLLAIIQAIAHRSLSGDGSLAEARQAFETRLQALTRINRQLTRSDWSGLSLKEIVRQELEPFVARALIEGIDLTLSPQHAQNLSLALHELATNAAKHGALSNGTGQIGVSWTVARSHRNNILKFRWQERGGPPVTAPTGVRFDYAADGVICEFEVPFAGQPAQSYTE